MKPYQQQGPTPDDQFVPLSQLRLTDGRPETGRFTVVHIADRVETTIAVAGRPADTVAFFTTAKVAVAVDRSLPEPPGRPGGTCLARAIEEAMSSASRRKLMPPATARDTLSSMLRRAGADPDKVLRAALACALRQLADGLIDETVALGAIAEADLVRRFAYRMNTPLVPRPPAPDASDGMQIATTAAPQRPDNLEPGHGLVTDHFGYRLHIDPQVPSTVGGASIHTYYQWLYRTGTFGVSCIDGGVFVNSDKYVDYAGPPEYWDVAARPPLPESLAFNTPNSATAFDLTPDVDGQMMRVHVSGQDQGTYQVNVSDWYCMGWVWPFATSMWVC